MVCKYMEYWPTWITRRLIHPICNLDLGFDKKVTISIVSHALVQKYCSHLVPPLYDKASSFHQTNQQIKLPPSYSLSYEEETSCQTSFHFSKPPVSISIFQSIIRQSFPLYRILNTLARSYMRVTGCQLYRFHKCPIDRFLLERRVYSVSDVAHLKHISA